MTIVFADIGIFGERPTGEQTLFANGYITGPGPLPFGIIFVAADSHAAVVQFVVKIVVSKKVRCGADVCARNGNKNVMNYVKLSCPTSSKIIFEYYLPVIHQ